MATRRRSAGPQGQTPLTDVVAGPVDTFVAPGAAGMPQAPTPLAKPVQDPQTDAVDYANLASAFGSLSSSLGQLGYAMAERERAEERERRRLSYEEERKLAKVERLQKEAEALREREDRKAQVEADKKEREAAKLGAEIAEQLDLMEIKRTQNFKQQFDTLVDEEQIYLTQHPAYSKALARGLAVRYAQLDYDNDAIEWDQVTKSGGEEYKESNWFDEWYQGKSNNRINTLPKWVTDDDSFRYNYIARRSQLSASLRKRHMILIGEEHRELERENISVRTSQALEAGVEDDLEGYQRFEYDAEQEKLIPVEGSEPPSRAQQAADVITQSLDDQRIQGIVKMEEANTLAVKSILNWIDRQDTVEGILYGLEVGELAQTGPQESRSPLLSGKNREIWEDAQGEIKKKISKIRQDEADAAFDAKALEVQQEFVNFLGLRIVGDAELGLPSMPVDDIPQLAGQQLDLLLQGQYTKGTDPKSVEARKDEIAFMEKFRDLNGTYDRDTRTITFESATGRRKQEVPLEKYVRIAQQTALTKQIANESAFVKGQAERGEGYRQANGEAFPPRIMDLFARGRALRVLKFNSDKGFQSQFRNLIFGNEEGNETLPMRLEAAMLIYQDLAEDRAFNPNLVTDVLGEGMTNMADILMVLRDPEFPHATSMESVAQSFLEGKLDVEYIQETLRTPIQGSKSLGELLQEEQTTTEYLEELNRFEYVSKAFGRTGRDQVTHLAQILVGGFNLAPEEAAQKALDIMKRNSFMVAGVRISNDAMEPDVAKGTHPSMRVLNPEEIKREEQTILQQEQELSVFRAAKEAYENHYAKMKEFTEGKKRFTQKGDDTNEYKMWRMKLFDLENKLRKAKGMKELSTSDVVLFPETKLNVTREGNWLEELALTITFADERQRADALGVENVIYWPKKFKAGDGPEVQEPRGTMTGKDMLELATEGFRNGGMLASNKSVLKSYNEIIKQEGYSSEGRLVFVPAPRRGTNLFLLKTTVPSGGSRVVVPRGANRSSTWTLEEIIDISQTVRQFKDAQSKEVEAPTEFGISPAPGRRTPGYMPRTRRRVLSEFEEKQLEQQREAARRRKLIEENYYRGGN